LEEEKALPRRRINADAGAQQPLAVSAGSSLGRCARAVA